MNQCWYNANTIHIAGPFRGGSTGDRSHHITYHITSHQISHHITYHISYHLISYHISYISYIIYHTICHIVYQTIYHIIYWFMITIPLTFIALRFRAHIYHSSFVVCISYHMLFWNYNKMNESNRQTNFFNTINMCDRGRTVTHMQIPRFHTQVWWDISYVITCDILCLVIWYRISYMYDYKPHNINRTNATFPFSLLIGHQGSIYITMP